MTSNAFQTLIETAFVAACRSELAAIKPGNVHIHAAGHGMDADTFERAAFAAGPIIADQSRSVGKRILDSVLASFTAAGCNANLGILLLAAPLARAFETMNGSGPEALRQSLTRVLEALDAHDARDVFAAIAHASPGGLGEDEKHDVRNAPTIGVLDAMRLSRAKDQIARQYATGFSAIFETGLQAAGRADPIVLKEPALGPAFAIHLRLASRFPDSHIARKFGPDAAETVRERFAAFAERIGWEENVETIKAGALVLDAELKAEGRNPGTTADLTVATLFVIALCDPGFFVPPLRKRRRGD